MMMYEKSLAPKASKTRGGGKGSDKEALRYEYYAEKHITTMEED